MEAGPLGGVPGVAVIGSMSADMTAKSARLPRPGETVSGSAFTLVSGGKGGNQAVMAAHMGVPTYMVGCVGEDPFQHTVLDSLRLNDVNITQIGILPHEQTGIAHIRVDNQGQNDIVIVPHANTQVDQAKVDEFFASGVAVNTLLLQLEIPLGTVAYAAERAHEQGITVILNPAPAAALPESLYRNVDILTPNETEAAALTGIEVTDETSAASAAEVLYKRGIPTVILTLGEAGAFVRDGTGGRHVPSYKVTAVDTTAAGDAFTGSLGACLSQGMPLDAAMPFALAAGACTVTRMGAQSSLPSREEVETLMASAGGVTQA